MALPFLIPLLIGGGVLGAAHAKKKDKNILEGALKGMALGGLGAAGAGALGLGAAGTAGTAATTGATAAKTGATTAAGLKAAASPFASSTAASAAKSLAANPLQSLTAESLGALTAGGTMSPVATAGSGLSQAALNQAALVTPTVATKGLTGAQKARIASQVLDSAREEQAPPPVAQQVSFGSGNINIPSVEEQIATSVSTPTFVPKGLYEEGRNKLDEEKLMMLQQQLNSRGLT